MKALTLFVVIAGMCAAFMFGRTTASPVTIIEKEIPELTTWQTLELAIIKTESEFDPMAIGKDQDCGIFQITPVYVDEVNRLLDTVRYYHNDAFSIEKSLEMFAIYQNAKNPQRDIEKAIRLHNPGGDAIGYTDKVMNNYRKLMEMEEIRKQIIEK